MAGSINKVTIVGNVGKDPEAKETSTGKTLCRFSVATSERWTDKAGAAQERTEWHSIKCWGGLANLCRQYLKRGAKVAIEGRLESREDEQGRRFWDIVANDVVFMSKRDTANTAPTSSSSDAWGQKQPSQPQPQSRSWGDWREN
ncbi:MAG: single-stranded DNA-binding protein [Rhodospirillaceae bacterium]|nr:single-stranded DNA-binding protein [Rhodospirillaceae bacterium]|tara:strand:- start:86 stop:517 length:432 start_codon:yes stop_codon:yes gene_type:complete